MAIAPNTSSASATVAATQGSGSVAASVAAAAKAGADAARSRRQSPRATPPPACRPARCWACGGGALIRTLDGEVRPLKAGDVVKKGEVILTTQDGIVQIEGSRQASTEIERVIADVNKPNPDAPTAAGITAPGGDDSLQPGLRVDRVQEDVTPAGLAFDGFAGRVTGVHWRHGTAGPGGRSGRRRAG